MPVFKVDVQKKYLDRVWTNRWLVNYPDLTGASTAALQILAAEIAIHPTYTLIQAYRVSDIVPGTDNFITTVVNTLGEFPSDGSILPLWNVVRVDLSVGAGRPSRKYFRSALTENNTENGNLSGALITTFENAIADLLTGVDLCDPQLTPIVAGQCFPQIAMRQLRRGSKRKTEGVITP